MPRPKLSPLSSLLPQKGAATRPEPIGQANPPAAKQETKQASIREGESEVKLASEIANKQASNHKEGARSAVSFRMTEGLQERLRVYAFETRRSKQDILDDALHDYLQRLGF